MVSSQIYAKNMNEIPKMDSYGYIGILYGNGARIVTALHFKDSTKYLDAFMRLESMTDNLINDTLSKYDEFEKKWYLDNVVNGNKK